MHAITANLRNAAFAVGLLASAALSQAAPLAAVGPDAFGYSGSAIASNLRNVSTSGTFLNLSDDSTITVNIGFSFSFYGINYSQAVVSSNGFLQLGAPADQGCCQGLPLPGTSSPNGTIAGLWEDLNFPQGNIRYRTVGAAGAREFIVGFYGVEHFAGGNPVTFEMILKEGSNDIEFQYGSLLSDGGLHTVGIENQTGTTGLQVYRGSVLDFDNTGYLISRNDVPEPSALALVGLALAGLGLSQRRRRQG